MGFSAQTTTVRACAGFTLIELMLAVVLSAVVSYDVIECVLRFQVMLSQQQERLQLLDSANFIADLLSFRSQKNSDAHCREHSSKRLIAVGADQLTLSQCIEYHRRWQRLNVVYFIARNYRGSSSLYRRPMGGRREELAANVITLQVDPSTNILWLLFRSARRYLTTARCYYFINRRYCPKDGYVYLSWPIALY